MPTALSWTETTRAVQDVGHLLRFRRAAVRRRAGSRWGIGLVATITVSAAIVPAFLDTYRTPERIGDVLIVMPSALGAFLLISILSGIASGGGRELLSREQGVTFPVSPTTDHLGALLLAPLNVAWLVQAWALLGAMAFGNGSAGLLGAQLVIVLWIVVATCAAQVVAWAAEAVRRGPAGIMIVRVAGAAMTLAAGWLYLVGLIGATLDALPSTQIVLAALSAESGNWSRLVSTVVVLLALIPVLVTLGAGAAHIAAKRSPRDELRIESETHNARTPPATDLLGLLRVDRASVWRVVPMRRGIVFLAFGPGLVGLAGGLDWAQLTILPGLVASGGALLFGVNMWCLENRGILWRESLPIHPGTVFSARVIVLLEFLLVSSGFTILLVVAARRRAELPGAGLDPVHLARRDHAGGVGVDAVVAQAALRGRPALGPGNPGAARGHGRLLRTARRVHDVHQPDLLRPRAHPRVGALGVRRAAVPGVVDRTHRLRPQRLAGPDRPGARRLSGRRLARSLAPDGSPGSARGASEPVGVVVALWWGVRHNVCWRSPGSARGGVRTGGRGGGVVVGGASQRVLAVAGFCAGGRQNRWAWWWRCGGGCVTTCAGGRRVLRAGRQNPAFLLRRRGRAWPCPPDARARVPAMPVPDQRRVLVTGAARGLGAALVRAFRARGDDVLATDREDVDVVDLHLDVTSAGDWATARETVEQRWGGLDVLVNNAGVAGGGRLDVAGLDEWRWITEINLFGAVQGTATFVPVFKRQRSGHLVNIASLAGLVHPAGMASYNAVKAAVVALTETAGHELAAYGVRASVVCPSYFRTDLVAGMRGRDTALGALIGQLVASAPLGPDEIAAAVLDGIDRGDELILPDEAARAAYALKRDDRAAYDELLRRQALRLDTLEVPR